MAQFKKRKDRKPRKRRVCLFCADKKELDFKDVPLLRKFMTDRGKIATRRASGACAKHQRLIASAIKKARTMGLIPYVVE